MNSLRDNPHGHGTLNNLGCTDITDDICMAPLLDTLSNHIGYWFCHAVPGEDVRCCGVLHTTDAYVTKWEEHGSLGGDKNLTLSPSIQCSVHPVHGYVRNGAWVPA